MKRRDEGGVNERRERIKADRKELKERQRAKRTAVATCSRAS